MRAHTSLKPLHQTIGSIAKWYETPLGQSMLAAQQQVLSEELSCLFGYHLMQLSVLPNRRLSESSRINHCFSLSPAVVNSSDVKTHLCDVQGLADLDALPLPDESIDVTLLHHVLEFSNNPHKVLKEAARVTVPRGHIVIFGFNPLSMLGLIQLIAQFYSANVIWKRRALRAGRLRDWLEFLDFSCVRLQYLSHNLPINHARYQVHSRFMSCKTGSTVPFGSTFCLIARKDKVGLTPLKPEWDKSTLLGASQIRKRSMSARSSRSALILPLRRKNKFHLKR
ncbi:methyltransferase domain-containing protein [Teredinibacter purpureus]|uniref:methyltransferase domain-containing protein n=1 Tax=Teredinibacter purpureus TaxID=2731756 RepID=UPI001F225154|nr:methyltransferase domain-containing protein [Teredinibacter purpureus]